MAAPTISCPGCGKSYSVDRPELVGKKAQCKQCHTRFVITDPRVSGTNAAKPASGSAATRPASGLMEAPASGISAPATKSGVTLPMQAERRPAPPATSQPAPASPTPANPDEHYPDDLMTISFTEYEARKTRQALLEALEKKKQKPE